MLRAVTLFVATIAGASASRSSRQSPPTNHDFTTVGLPRLDSSQDDRANEFFQIQSSRKLRWSPCYEAQSPNLTCARLEVPMDYDDSSHGTTAIAFIKYTVNPAEDAPSILINPGGPGGSGVRLVQKEGKSLAQVMGAKHNVVGFDPRGVQNSGPAVECWPDHPAKRAQFEKYFYWELPDVSSAALANVYYAADLFGAACSATVGGSRGNASFITTPLVARDMLAFIDAEHAAAKSESSVKAKLSYFGVSYGTILGATFASMFPDRIEKMILDGVFEASDYYSLKWRSNTRDTEKVLDSFFSSCFKAGASKCTFWGPSVHNISDRFDRIVTDLKSHPIPIPSPNPSTCGVPLMATYSDLKQFILRAMYAPLDTFSQLAAVLSGLEQGNTTAYESAVTSGAILGNPCANATEGLRPDVENLIGCADGWRGKKITSLKQFEDYVDNLTAQSRFFGDVWSITSPVVSCRSVDVKPPTSGKLPGSFIFTHPTSNTYHIWVLDLTPARRHHGA